MAKYEVESVGGGASKYEVESVAPQERPQLPQDRRYEVVSTPTTGEESLDAVGRPIPSLRQGSPSDFHSLATEGPYGPPKPKRSSLLPEWMNPKYMPAPLEAAMRQYQESIVDPIKSRLYGETLPPEMVHPFVAPTPEERQAYQTTETLKTIGSDPMLLVPAAAGVGRGLLIKPLRRVEARPAVQPAVPITAPVVELPPVAPIQELARAHTDRLVSSLSEPSSGGLQPSLPQTPLHIGVLPTESLERSLQFPETTGLEGTLRTLPTGSLLKIQRPGKESTAVPQVAPYPDVPSVQRLPAEYSSFESRPLHGAPVYGPPRPPLRSAEEILQQRLAERPEPPPIDLPNIDSEPPELTQLMKQPEQMGPRETAVPEISGDKTLSQSSPSLIRRVLQHAFDTLDDMGPYTRAIGDILRYTFDYSEAGTRANFLDYVKLIQDIYGPEVATGRRVLTAKVKRAIQEGLPAALNSSIRDFGLTQKEQHALVELHEIGQPLLKDHQGTLLDHAKIEQLVSPKAWETLRAELLDPRLQRLFREGWQIMTGRASSLPSVQSKARIHDFITGKSTPVGEPSPFWPHQPIRDETTKLLAEANLKAMYRENGYEAAGIPYENFVKNYSAMLRETDPAKNLRRFAGLEYKRHLNMLKDAKAHNRTVAESLEFYGYGTDPLQVLLRHNLYALKRAAYLEREEVLTGLRQQVRVEYGEGSRNHDWVEKVIQRAQGISEREDILSRGQNSWSIAQAIMYPAFLKASWLQNFLLQPNYVQMQTGLRPIAQAVWRRYGKMLGLTEKDILESADRSGANFPSFMAKYHTPEGLFHQYNKTMNELNLFAPSDWVTRTWSGEVGIPHAENLIRKWYQDPANPKWQNALKEGNLNPKELMQKMLAADRSTWENGIPPIPQEALMRYAQALANRAMGRTGIRSLPLWMSSEGQTAKIFMMLHRQIASNEGVFFRNIMNAPTAGVGLMRALRAVFGAELAGTLYQGVTNWIVGNNFFDVNEPLKKTFKDNKAAAFMAKSLLLGIGTFTGGIILSGLNLHAGNYGGTTYGLLSPPAASFVDEIVTKVTQGRFGDVALRVNPSQIVDVISKRHEKEEKRRKRASMPGKNLGVTLP